MHKHVVGEKRKRSCNVKHVIKIRVAFQSSEEKLLVGRLVTFSCFDWLVCPCRMKYRYLPPVSTILHRCS
jgi:hypothetical protein